MSSEWTVSELLKRCSEDPADDAAWDEFVRRYDATIRKHVTKTFQRKVREDSDRKAQFPEDSVEDLVQAVYIKLVEDDKRALGRFEGEYHNSIYQYLGMISVNSVRDYFRETRAQKRPKLTYSLDELLEKGGDNALLERSLAHLNGAPIVGREPAFTRAEIDSALKRAASGRNRDRDALIFKLRYYEGLTLEEITQVLHLDISPISVGSILHRISNKMKQLIDPSGNDR